MLTVIACVVLVTVGIVGAMKMEDHLDPSRSRERRPRAGRAREAALSHRR